MYRLMRNLFASGAIALLAATLAIEATSVGGVWRRQAIEVEDRTSTAKPKQDQQEAASQAGRLYPDVPQAPCVGPNYPAPGRGLISNFNGPTPYLPFALNSQLPRDPTNQQQIPWMRQMSPTERLQSQSFTDNLGKRILSMIGIRDTDNQNSTTAELSSENAMKALQNTTLVKEINRRLGSAYNNLVRMYDTMMRQQMDPFQTRFFEQDNNSTTGSWPQRVAEQVPNFFKNIAARVEGAQDSWERMMQQFNPSGSSQNPTSTQTSPLQRPTRSFFDQVIPDMP